MRGGTVSRGEAIFIRWQKNMLSKTTTFACPRGGAYLTVERYYTVTQNSFRLRHLNKENEDEPSLRIEVRKKKETKDDGERIFSSDPT